MSTEYTRVLLEDKEPTFEEFALLCARNFGACISMRDEPLSTKIPDEFEVSDYYIKLVKEKKEELDYYSNLTKEQIEVLVEKENKERHENYKQCVENNNKIKQRYEDMLKKIKMWQPPSNKHIELKKFMIQQIKSSIEWDVHVIFEPEKIDTKTLQALKIKELQDEINYYSKEYDKEVKMVESRNLWIKQLRESLKNNG